VGYIPWGSGYYIHMILEIRGLRGLQTCGFGEATSIHNVTSIVAVTVA
jgi:hypothetical protein